MRGIIFLVLAAIAVIAVVSVFSFVTHFLFSPWLLLAAAVAALGWFRLRRRARR